MSLTFLGRDKQKYITSSIKSYSTLIKRNVFLYRTPRFTITIYHQGFFHSVRRNPSLNCLHRRQSLAILVHAGPRWRIGPKVVSLSCYRSSLPSCPFSWCPLFFGHMLSLNLAICSAHPGIPFLITSLISVRPTSVAYQELVSRGVSKSRKFKWLVKVGACKDVNPLI